MSTNYTLNGFTLRNHNEYRRIVAIMDSVNAPGKHITYKDYTEKTEFMDDNTYRREEGRYFILYERESFKDQLTTLNRRFFSKRHYAKSIPQISTDQTIVSMPRFDLRDRDEFENEDLIDIYDCSDENFWLKSKPVDPEQDEDFKCQLRLGDKDHSNFESISFSENKRFACVLCTNKVMVYNIGDALDSGMHGTELQAIPPQYEKEIDPATYDGVLSVSLREGIQGGINENEGSFLDTSWVVLQS